MRQNSAAVLRTTREASELRHCGRLFGEAPSEPLSENPPRSETELRKEFDRPDLDYLQDLREAEGLGDHYTQYGVVDD